MPNYIVGVGSNRVQILEDDLQTFTGIAIFRLVLFVSLSFFSLFEVFRLHANKAKKTTFFSLQSEKKKGLFFAYFRFKRK
jgi:hypothetical protein